MDRNKFRSIHNLSSKTNRYVIPPEFIEDKHRIPNMLRLSVLWSLIVIAIILSAIVICNS
jgi:hypothetical protein